LIFFKFETNGPSLVLAHIMPYITTGPTYSWHNISHQTDLRTKFELQ